MQTSRLLMHVTENLHTAFTVANSSKNQEWGLKLLHSRKPQATPAGTRETVGIEVRQIQAIQVASVTYTEARSKE